MALNEFAKTRSKIHSLKNEYITRQHKDLKNQHNYLTSLAKICHHAFYLNKVFTFRYCM